MRGNPSISEILGTVHDGKVEICVAAEAAYAPAEEKVTITLTASARPSAATGETAVEEWLPAGERVLEHMPREEVDDFLHEVFASWVRKVRAAVPPHLTLRS